MISSKKFDYCPGFSVHFYSKPLFFPPILSERGVNNYINVIFDQAQFYFVFQQETF